MNDSPRHDAAADAFVGDTSELLLRAATYDAALQLGAPGDRIWFELFEAAPIALSYVDPSGKQLAMNAAFADLVGHRPDERSTIKVADLTREEDREWTAGYLSRLVAGEIDTFNTDKVFVRRDGSQVTVTARIRAIRTPDGQCIGMLGAFHPAEERGQVQDARLRRLLSHSEATVTVVDENGAIFETTGRYQTVLGYPAEFWENRTIFDLLAPGQELIALAFREEVLANPGQRRSAELRLIGADGEQHAIRLHAINLLDHPDVRGVILTTINITEELQMFEGLHQRTATAEAVVKAQTMLLATVSHELRNPLHALQGVAELLVNEPLSTRALTLASELLTQLTGLTDLTQDLLDTAQATAGTVRIRLSRVALHQLVDEVSRYGVAMATNARPGIVVRHRIDPGVPELVVSDPVRLRQILRNLVGNAIKFTPTGSVELHVSVISDGLLRFAVTDSGAGIPADELDRIREPFVTGALAGAQGGAGLGLSIVNRTVSALGGSMNVTSTFGVGSTFSVDVPVEVVSVEQGPTGAPTSPDQSPAAIDLTGHVVLVVEDNAVNQQLARGQLSRLGMEAHIVGSGEEAIELLSRPDRPRFDVVLMDHGLPGMDGVQTMQAMRAMRETHPDVAAIPVICVTASAAAADRQRFLEQGMDGFVSKPASLASIKAGITELLTRGAGSADPIDATEPTADKRSSGSDASPASGPASTGPAASGPGQATTDDAAYGIVQRTMTALCDDFGDTGLVDSLADTFIEELPGRLSAIVDAGDQKEASRAGHTLKSSARLLGASELASMCEGIERGAAPDRASLESLSVQAVTSLRRWLARNGS